MYSDPTQYAYLFQHHAIMAMSDRHRLRTALLYRVMERSIFSCRCFTEARRRQGKFTELESHLLMESVRRFAEGSVGFEVDLIIYLPEVIP